MQTSKEKQDPLTRWREMFTPEAREERLLRGEHARQQRHTMVSRAFGKQTTREETNND